MTGGTDRPRSLCYGCELRPSGHGGRRPREGPRDRTLPRLRFLLVAFIAATAGLLVLACRGGRSDPSGDRVADLLGLVRTPPAPLPEGDLDQDGLSDAEEDALAHRYAPIVILDRRDPVRPASVPWLLARQPDVGCTPGMVLASAVPLPEPERTPFSESTRKGSDDPADWTTYVHVYPRADGGINVQYWFFYPYNDGPLFFDHESDWEHLTVRLSAGGLPIGAYLSRHEDNNPGVYRRWSRLRLHGGRPVVLSARGTHAVYTDVHDMPWFEQAAACVDLKTCNHPVWRTWEGGGLVNLGERARPAAGEAMLAVASPVRWGRAGFFPGTSAPRSPAHQRGWCHAGFQKCREAAPPAAPEAAGAAP